MHLDVYLIERLSTELNHWLGNAQLQEAFSTSKEQLFLCFDQGRIIKVQWYKGEIFFQFPNEHKIQKTNRLKIFPEIVGQKIEEISTVKYDRVSAFKFTGGYSLFFLLFGKFGQLTLANNGQIEAQFPVKSKQFKMDSFFGNRAKQDLSDVSLEQLNSIFKFLSVADVKALSEWDAFSADQKNAQWKAFYNQKVNNSSYGITKHQDSYSLVAEPKQEDTVAQYNVLKDALNDFTALYIASSSFVERKTKLLKEAHSKLKVLEKQKTSYERSVEKAFTSHKYKEQADLLMANLHLTKKGMTEIILKSFDQNEQVSIKLKRDLNGQENAERLYKKSKNEIKQIKYIEEQLDRCRAQIAACQSSIDKLDNVEGFKELKKYGDTTTQKNQDKKLPYKLFEFDGFEIRVGKSAKDNDELLRSYSSKNDLWLHAKDVSGSHVIIRKPNNKNIGIALLEKCASLAAYYSKAKSESLATVIYTERKYVRKPKGAYPGLVKVDQYESILIEPAQF